MEESVTVDDVDMNSIEEDYLHHHDCVCQSATVHRDTVQCRSCQKIVHPECFGWSLHQSDSIGPYYLNKFSKNRMLTMKEMEGEFHCSFDDASTSREIEIVIDIPNGRTLREQCQIELLGGTTSGDSSGGGGEALYVTMVHMSQPIFGVLYPFDHVLSVTMEEREKEEKTFVEPCAMREVMMMTSENMSKQLVSSSSSSSYLSSSSSSSSTSSWSESEVEKLMTAAFKYGQRTTDAMDWSKVMLAVSSRSLTDCQNKHAEVVQERRSLREEVEHHQCRLTLKVRRWTKMKHRGEEGEEDRNDWYVVEQRTNVTEMLRQVASFRSQTATTACCITVLPEVGTSGAMDATKEGVHVQEKKKEGEEEEEGEQVQEKEEKKGRRKKRSVPTLPRGSHIFSGVPFHRMNYEKNLNMGAISRVMFEHVHPVGKE